MVSGVDTLRLGEMASETGAIITPGGRLQISFRGAQW